MSPEEKMLPGLDRRAFGRLAGAGVLGTLAGESTAAQAEPMPMPARARTRVLMKVGTQQGSSDEVLTVLAALGVNNICAALPSERLDESWSVEQLVKLRERVESFGIHLDMLPLPLSSHYITRAENPLKRRTPISCWGKPRSATRRSTGSAG